MISDSQRIKLLWNIVNYINDKLCQNKLVIKKIVLIKDIKEQKPYDKTQGYYEAYKKVIGIRRSLALISQLSTLCHELAHAYQYQILNYSFNRNRIHDKKGNEICKRFHKATDNILYIK